MHNHSNYDDVEALRWQAAQVSTISVMNCLGRIFICKSSVLRLTYPPNQGHNTAGLMSDFVKNEYDMLEMSLTCGSQDGKPPLLHLRAECRCAQQTLKTLKSLISTLASAPNCS